MPGVRWPGDDDPRTLTQAFRAIGARQRCLDLAEHDARLARHGIHQTGNVVLVRKVDLRLRMRETSHKPRPPRLRGSLERTSDLKNCLASLRGGLRGDKVGDTLGRR